MYELDAAVTHAINSLAGCNAIIDFLMMWVSAIGVPLMVLAVILHWWRRTDRSHTRHVLVGAGLSFLLGLAVNQFILLFVHRMRPYDGGVTHLLIAPSADPSFPSDHATASFAIAAAFLLHGMWRVGFGASNNVSLALRCLFRISICHRHSTSHGASVSSISTRPP